MSRDELHIRDRLMMLAESTKPFNVKRKSVSKQSSKGGGAGGGGGGVGGGGAQGPKLSMQDFVRMDPSYTPDIEHLVFPGRKRNPPHPQQVAPAVVPSSTGAAKTRSRLAEMFALSRHLQQRSADREVVPKPRTSSTINRSVDSVLDSGPPPVGRRVSQAADRRWLSTSEEHPREQQQQPQQPVHAGTRLSPGADTDMATTRGPNVSVLHLRSTSEPWETSPTSVFTASTASSRSYSSVRSNNAVPSLTKHQSLGSGSNYTSSYKQPRSDSYTADMYLGQSYHRELSPVRWCDREVDGVYLGRSGWVQVQQRSLDDNRRSYKPQPPISALSRTGMKLAEYQYTQHSNSLKIKPSEPQRPAYLPLKPKDFELSRSPSPERIPIESFSPPSITPIISPPPAFQDRNKVKTRTFFGKPHFLPRSNAIIDSDVSPPPTPPASWKTTKTSSLPPPTTQRIKQKTPSPVRETLKYPRIPQTKSLEDTSAARRSKFVQKYGESSSSSSQSSSMGFRSLDSYVPRRSAMPRLSENTDSSVDVYEDADDEDNNSSSLNLSIVSPKPVMMTTSVDIHNRPRDKISPSNRNSRLPYRNPIRKSPQGSDTKPTSPGSSSSSSNEFPSRSPSNTTSRRTPPRQYQEDVSSRVRRSRSLQLPEKKTPPRLSPQHPDSHRIVVKVANNSIDRPKRQNKLQRENELDGDMLREAEVVTGFLYGSRSRAAAQALLIHRYNNREEKPKETKAIPVNNGYNVYVVGGSNKQKKLQRGSTTPNLNNSKNICCDFYPHCSHREVAPPPPQPMMRSSQSYPSHQRSLEVPEPYSKKRVPVKQETVNERRISPGSNHSNNGVIRKASPVNPKTASSSSSTSSSTEMYVTATSDRSAKSPRTVKSSGGSTPVDEVVVVRDVREVILTRPGSAPGSDNKVASDLDSQQRSMSLPKSFLSKEGSQFPWKRRGTESLGSSPGIRRRTPGETSQTAPVTPLHDGNRRRSPIDGASRRAKATSTPQLLDPVEPDNRKWKSASVDTGKEIRKLASGNTTESVLQKFRKTFSLRFQKKGSKDSSCASDVGENLFEILGEDEPSEEVDNVQAPANSPASVHAEPTKDIIDQQQQQQQQQHTEQKHRFGPLIWRSSKERNKLNKAARNMKCNSGDSGIQIEMVSGGGGGGTGGSGGGGGGGGESSESHDTDAAGEELDSPPAVRRRGARPPRGARPHSDLLNQILLDRFKAELKSRGGRKHRDVRRTNSDLGGRRIYQWEHRRLMTSPPPAAADPARAPSPRKRPPDGGGGHAVQLRANPHLYRRGGQLRRSLSQPLDIDKLSPLLARPKGTSGVKMTGAAVSEDEHDGRLGTSDDETMSDSESSIASLSDRKKSLELPMDEDVVILAEAVFDHVTIEADELAFRAGDVIEVLETVNRDWWWGSTSGRTGWFLADSVRLRVSQEDTVEDCLAAMASGKPSQAQIRRKTSISLLSNDQVRTSVVRELVHTERDFVKVLRDVSEGYMSECAKRKDMFTKEQIDAIFINLEEILRFQSAFLKDLESCIDWEAPHKSCVGSCFIKHKEGFTMYSDYCNSHPMATATLQELYQFNNYSKFFEACRLMRGLIEIPLDGYLLTPVQRICKYPLQLAELLKYTKPEHADYADIREALNAMRGVAVLINERKRRMESLEKIEAWQQRVEGWEGEDLIELSTQLIHQGEVVRVTTGMWTSNIMLFLFDHQLVYCKKDILKRNTYVYKGRICLDTSEIINVPDGKDAHLGVNVRHAIKLYSCVRDKWLLVCCRSENDKQRWLQAFADERRLVAQDQTDGLDFPASSRHLAKIAARCQRRPPRKIRSDKNYKRDASYMGSTLQLNSTHSNSLGRRVGTWFTFGGNKKTRHRGDIS